MVYERPRKQTFPNFRILKLNESWGPVNPSWYSETHFVLGFHLNRHRVSPQAFTMLEAVKNLGSPHAIVSDRYKLDIR